MLQPIMHKLSQMRIVLASGSSCRKEILEQVGLSFEIIPSTFPEDLDKSSFSSSIDYVKETARRKISEVTEKLKHDEVPPDMIIGADTIVTLDDTIYEKPKDKEDAFRMLSSFSGRSHQVHTAVWLVFPKILTEQGQPTIKHFHETTEVMFCEVTPELVRSYIETGEPMGKAGGYGIQGIGASLMKGIVGDFFNVMGLPLHRTVREIYNMFR